MVEGGLPLPECEWEWTGWGELHGQPSVGSLFCQPWGGLGKLPERPPAPTPGALSDHPPTGVHSGPHLSGMAFVLLLGWAPLAPCCAFCLEVTTAPSLDPEEGNRSSGWGQK